jgi:hypothetical protein
MPGILAAHSKKAARSPRLGKNVGPALEASEQRDAKRVRELAERIRGSPHFSDRMLPLLEDAMSIEHCFSIRATGENIDTSSMLRHDALESFCALVEGNRLGERLGPLMEEMHRKFRATENRGATMDTMASKFTFIEKKRDLGLSLSWSIKYLRRLADNPALGDAYAGLAEAIANRRSFPHIGLSFSLMDAMLKSGGMERLARDSAKFSASFMSLSDSMEKAAHTSPESEPLQFYAYVTRMILHERLDWRLLPALGSYLADLAMAPRPSPSAGWDDEAYDRWAAASISTFEAVLCSRHLNATARDALVSASESGARMLVFDTVSSLGPLLGVWPARQHARMIDIVSKKAALGDLARAYRSLGPLMCSKAFDGRMASAVNNAMRIMDSSQIPHFLSTAAEMMGQDHAKAEAAGAKYRTISSLASLAIKGQSMHEPEKSLSLFAAIAGHGSAKGGMRDALFGIIRKESGNDLRFALVSLYALLSSSICSERLAAVARACVEKANRGAASDALDIVYAVSKSGKAGAEGISADMVDDIVAIANSISLLDKADGQYMEAGRLLYARMEAREFSVGCLSEIAGSLKGKKRKEIVDALSSH